MRRSFHGLERLLKTRRELMSRQDELLKEFVVKIVERFPRSTVILFGSRARGQERPNSDYDILVVMDLEDRYRLQKIFGNKITQAQRYICGRADSLTR